MSGSLVSPELLQQIYETIRHYLRTHRTGEDFAADSKSRKPSALKTIAVILDEDLDGVDFLSEPSGSVDPTLKNATVCQWSFEKNRYVQTEQRLHVANHSAEEKLTDTPGAAIPIDGHYWFFGDCDPLEDRPEPPWKSGTGL